MRKFAYKYAYKSYKYHNMYSMRKYALKRKMHTVPSIDAQLQQLHPVNFPLTL